MNYKSVVIGGNGFIGSHLVDMLVRAGHEVSVLDRFSSGAPVYASGNVRRIVGDFLDRSHLSRAVRDQDLVFHFLSTTTPATAEADPTLDIRTNLTQTVELFEACADSGVSRVFFASTGGAIYGPQPIALFSEEDPARPVSPYGIVKLAIENYLGYFSATRGLPYTIFRISNPYGPRQKTNRPQGLIPVLLQRILAGLPVTRFGDGSMVRDYIYVNDLIEMIGRVVASEAPGTLYNIGRGEGHSVNEILGAVQTITQMPFSVIDQPTPVTFVQSSVLDVSKFEHEFGPFEFTPLVDGIRQTWQSMVAVRDGV